MTFILHNTCLKRFMKLGYIPVTSCGTQERDAPLHCRCWVQLNDLPGGSPSGEGSKGTISKGKDPLPFPSFLRGQMAGFAVRFPSNS